MLAVDEVVDHARLQRAGTEQRHQRDDVFEAVRLQAPDQVLHAARFELEHRGGLAAPSAARRSPRRPSAASLMSSGGSPLRARARVDRSCTAQSMIVSVRRPRKSNFTRPAASTSSLSNCVTTLPPPVFAVQRREVGQHRGRDHHAAGVHAGVARQAFERARQVDEVLDLLLVRRSSRLSSGSFVERIVERDAELERDELGDPVDVAVASCRARGPRRAPPPSRPSCRR